MSIEFLSYSTILQLPITLYIIGLCGFFLNRKNIIVILMSIELVLLAVTLNLSLASIYLDDSYGLVFSLFVLTIAAAESAIGLALLVIYYRITGTIQLQVINVLKG
jgi:NADH-quinone oxidoreductase subunit K